MLQAAVDAAAAGYQTPRDQPEENRDPVQSYNEDTLRKLESGKMLGEAGTSAEDGIPVQQPELLPIDLSNSVRKRKVKTHGGEGTCQPNDLIRSSENDDICAHECEAANDNELPNLMESESFSSESGSIVSTSGVSSPRDQYDSKDNTARSTHMESGTNFAEQQVPNQTRTCWNYANTMANMSQAITDFLSFPNGNPVQKNQGSSHIPISSTTPQYQSINHMYNHVGGIQAGPPLPMHPHTSVNTISAMNSYNGTLQKENILGCHVQEEIVYVSNVSNGESKFGVLPPMLGPYEISKYETTFLTIGKGCVANNQNTLKDDSDSGTNLGGKRQCLHLDRTHTQTATHNAVNYSTHEEGPMLHFRAQTHNPEQITVSNTATSCGASSFNTISSESNNIKDFKPDRIQIQRDMMSDGGSLFDTSPRSFLMGIKRQRTQSLDDVFYLIQKPEILNPKVRGFTF